MPLRLHIAIGLFLVAAIGGLIYAFSHSRSGELFDKRGWSVLQAMDDPSSQPSRVVLVRREEFDVLGFRGIGQPKARGYGAQRHWSWVLLNEHHADGDIKQMPRFEAYELPCSELTGIKQAARDADDYALQYLRSICTES